MKKICFLLLPVAVLLASVISCSSAPQNSESASANAALDNIFARKSVRTYLNKGVEKEKIDLMLRAGAVWTAAYPYEDRMEVVRKYIALPENILPLCVIPFGYPAVQQQPKQKYDEKKIHYQ